MRFPAVVISEAVRHHAQLGVLALLFTACGLSPATAVTHAPCDCDTERGSFTFNTDGLTLVCERTRVELADGGFTLTDCSAPGAVCCIWAAP